MGAESYRDRQLFAGTVWLSGGVASSLIGYYWPQIQARVASKNDTPEHALARVQARTGLVPEFNDIGLGQGTKATADGRKADGAAVLLVATVHNYGEPTSVVDYQLFVKHVNGRIEKGEPRPITPEKLKAQSLSGKPVQFSTDSLSDKTVAPIPQGGSVQGRLAFFFVGGDVHTFARSGAILRLIMKDSRNRRYAIEKPVEAVKGLY